MEELFRSGSIDQKRSSVNWPLAKALQRHGNAETGLNTKSQLQKGDRDCDRGGGGGGRGDQRCRLRRLSGRGHTESRDCDRGGGGSGGRGDQRFRLRRPSGGGQTKAPAGRIPKQHTIARERLVAFHGDNIPPTLHRLRVKTPTDGEGPAGAFPKMKKPIPGPFFLVWVFLMSRYRAGGLLGTVAVPVMCYFTYTKILATSGSARAFCKLSNSTNAALCN
jgi:hypothetical protein